MPKPHCSYSEGMLAWEAPETEEAAARAIALHPMAKAYHEGGHAVVGLALGALSLRRVVIVDEGVDAASEGVPKYGGQTQFGEGDQDQKETICHCWRIK
jgi:hypothetical protein